MQDPDESRAEEAKRLHVTEQQLKAPSLRGPACLGVSEVRDAHRLLLGSLRCVCCDVEGGLRHHEKLQLHHPGLRGTKQEARELGLRAEC